MEFYKDLTEDAEFDKWYNLIFGGSSIEKETARAAFIAGRITGLHFGYAYTNTIILEELRNLNAL